MSLIKSNLLLLPRIATPAWVSLLFIAVVLATGADLVRAQAISEGFDDIQTLVPAGWFMQNNSPPGGTTNWFQGTIDPFPAHAGPESSYIAANYHNTVGTNTISNWLLAPNREMNNGDVYKFWTRCVKGDPYPDRMQVRLSTNGASTNVGTSPTDVGDFTTLLLDIDPEYEGIYPDNWAEFTITIADLPGPTSGRLAFRYFVEDGGPTGNNSYWIGIDTFTYMPATVAAPPQHVVDFDADGRTDYSVVRNTGGGANGEVTWYQSFNTTNGRPGNKSATRTMGGSAGFAQQWGLASDYFVPADFDGDQKTDLAVWRAGPPFGSFFYIFESSTNSLRMETFGQELDDPTIVRDFTGDGKADPAVYRDGLTSGDPSYWFYLASDGPLSGQVVATQFGQRNDFPVPGDYNGDGKADFVVQRDANNGTNQAVFYIHNGTGGPDVQVPGEDQAVIFGAPLDMVVPGDYDGDGKTDLATVRSSGGQLMWFIRPSSTGIGNGKFPDTIWGLSTSDYVAQGDYDGDGRTDIAVWRPDPDPAQNYFYILGSSTGAPMSPVEWGQADDIPVANFDTH
jgi:hypothetical protein